MEDEMNINDIYEEYLTSLEIIFGNLPHRKELKQALKDSFSEADLRIYFLLPVQGTITPAELEEKAMQDGISREYLLGNLPKLVRQGVIGAYGSENNMTYGRQILIDLLELNFRSEGPLGLATAEVWRQMIDGKGGPYKAKTPSYRSVSYLETLEAKTTSREISLEATIDDPRETLPTDVVMELIKGRNIYGVGKCACRDASQKVGHGCTNPLELCLTFDTLAEVMINSGWARRIEFDEVVAIIKKSEELGLVHNVTNVAGNISFLCNCCTCCCMLLNSYNRGEVYYLSKSRYVVAYNKDTCEHCLTCADVCPAFCIKDTRNNKVKIDFAKCIGCGICVSKCPSDSLKMVLRDVQPEIPTDYFDLVNRQVTEAMKFSE
jgi:Pyruvate/2-oxoacid:ferredoxin oxidoreductase delta subunit